MKTKIELLGFEVEIEEVDGKLDVKVRAGEEVVEELSLDPSEYDLTVGEEDFEGEELATEDDGDIKSFDEFEGEDVDVEDVDVEDVDVEDVDSEDEEEEEEDDDCDDCDDDDVSESLRSFDNFFKKKKK